MTGDESVDAIVLFAMNAAAGGEVLVGGGVPPVLPATTTEVMPAFTGKSDSAVTSMEPPMMLAMSGVATANWHEIATVTRSPRPVVVPSPLVSVNTGSGMTGSPPTTGSSQLVWVASSRISLR